MKKTLFLVCLSICCVAAFASDTREKELKPAPVTGKAEIGVWDTDFEMVKAKADRYHIPMVVFWGHVGCQYCEFMIHCLNLANCQKYFKNRQILMAFELAPKDFNETRDADKYPGYKWMLANGANTGYPLMAVYWKKADGSVVSDFFCGARSQSPNSGRHMTISEGNTDEKIIKAVHKYDDYWYDTYRPGLAVGNTMLYQLEATIENTIMDFEYVEPSDGEFALSDSEGSHLEAEMSYAEDDMPGEAVTPFVTVPLRRLGTGGADISNWLVASWKEEVFKGTGVTVTNAVTVTNEIAWVGGVQEIWSQIDFKNPVVGDVSLSLLGEAKAEVDTSIVRIVGRQPVSQENPLWLGERTADTLAAGEWTMDLDVAKSRTAKQVGEAYTLVMVGGELWCPDCMGFRANVLETTEFANWADGHNVSLVLVDRPRDNQQCPTLLSFTEADGGVSGAAYLSRKGVTPEAAAAQFAVCYTNCFKTWNYAYENRQRLWLPTALLLRKDASLVAKLVGDRNYPNGTTFTLDDYMRRFEEMVELAEDDEGEFANNDWTTTEDEVAACGTIEGTLSAVDGLVSSSTAGRPVDYIRLTGVLAGTEVFARIGSTDGSDAKARFSILRQLRKTAVAPGEVVSSNCTLKAGAEISAQVDPELFDYYLKVEGQEPDGIFAYSNALSSVRAYRIETSYGVSPRETESTIAVSGSIDMSVEYGKEYRLSVSTGTLACDDLVALGGGFYAVRDPGTVRVTLTFSKPCDFTFAVWNPGEVGFSWSEDEFAEGSGICPISVVRAGGSSGEARATVSLPDWEAGVDFAYYSWPTNSDGTPKSVTLSWAAGESGVKTLTNLVALTQLGYFGDFTVRLKLETVPGSSAEVGEDDEFRATILEKDLPAKGQVAIVGTDPALQTGKTIVWAREGEPVKVFVERQVGYDGDISATLSGNLVGSTNLTWRNKADRILEPVFIAPTFEALKGKTSVTLTLKSSDRTVPVPTAGKTVTIKVISKDALSFATKSVGWAATQYVAFSNDVAIAGEPSGKVSVKRLSGSIPSGLSAKVVGDRMVLSGTPSRAGTFHATYQVVETVGGRSLAGDTVDIAISVADIAESTYAGAQLPVKAVSMSGLVAEYQNEDDYRSLAGLISLTCSRKGLSSASYDSWYGKVSFRSAGWKSYVSDDGFDTLELEAVSGEYVLTLRVMGGDSSIFAYCQIKDPHFPNGDDLLGVFSNVIKGEEAKAWTGVYNVNFSTNAIGNALRPENAPTGHAYMKLNITASAAKSGKFSFAGMLADGTTLSGSTSLYEATLTKIAEEFFGTDKKVAFVPLFKRQGAANVFAGGLWIGEGGAAHWQDNPRLITTRIPFAWHHVNTGVLEDGGTEAYDVLYDANGGYYDTKMKLEDYAATWDLSTGYTINVDKSDFPVSEIHGEVVSVADTALADVSGQTMKLDRTTASSGLTFSFSRSTGVFSGRFKVGFADGVSVWANYKGIVLPGWGEGCGGCGAGLKPGATIKAFGLGAVHYNDVVPHPTKDGKTVSVKRGAKIELWPLHDLD